MLFCPKPKEEVLNLKNSPDPIENKVREATVLQERSAKLLRVINEHKNGIHRSGVKWSILSLAQRLLMIKR